MSARTLAFALSLGVFVLAGCKSAPLDDVYRAHYTTTPPLGAVVLPYPPQTVQPPLVIPQPK
jgi:hypothetical protein